MISHVWSVLCASSAIDRDTNVVSLFDVLDSIRGEVLDVTPTSETAIIPIRMQLVTLWAREEPNRPTSGLGRVRLLAPNGDELLKSENPVDLSEFKRRRVRLNMAGMPHVGNGCYRFLVESYAEGAWTTVASIPLEVEITVTERKAGETPAADSFNVSASEGSRPASKTK